MFQDLQIKKRGKAIFRGNQHSRIIGVGEFSMKSSLSINNVLLLDSPKHNLLTNPLSIIWAGSHS